MIIRYFIKVFLQETDYIIFFNIIHQIFKNIYIILTPIYEDSFLNKFTENQILCLSKIYFLIHRLLLKIKINQTQFKMRRKQIILLVVFSTIFIKIHGQDESCNCIDDKGIIIGYNTINYSISKPSPDEGDYFDHGFFIGFFADIELSKKIHVQPEFTYNMSFKKGINYNTIAIPIMLKYFITNQISLQGGLMYDVIYDDIFMENSGIHLIAGIGVKISDSFTALIRYSDSLTKRGYIYEKERINYDFNYLQVGLAFRLWKRK